MDGNTSSSQDSDASTVRLLQQKVTELTSILSKTAELCEQQQQRIQELEEETKYWKQCLFGRRSERFESADQGYLFATQASESDAALHDHDFSEEASLPRRHRRRSGGWGKIPDHLPRVEEVIDIPESERVCPETGQPLVRIGEDRTERVEYRREDVYVRVIIRPKYALPASSPTEGIVQAEAPVSPVPGGRYGFGIVTEVLTNRFADHLPYYRQQDTFARCGLELSRSTLCNLTGHGSFLLEPLVHLMRRRLVASDYLGVDDTPVRLADPTHPGGMRTARFWLYRGSEPAAYDVFDFHESRSRDGPVEFLKQFSGWVTVDAYGVHNGVYVGSDAIRASCCNSHARRKFKSATSSHPSLAAHALGLYRRLYDIEDRAKTLTAENRLALRQQESQPVMDSLETWLREQQPQVLPKSKLGEAIRYAINQWNELQAFLHDGHLPIDNNATENALRSLTIGRNNWLFVGSDDAGQRAATIYSVVASAHRHHLDVWAYLHDVLEQSAAGTTPMEELLPDVWAKSHPNSIRTFRQREQERTATKKRERRQRRRALQQARRNS